MEILSVQELDALKYSELQKVAKKAGLKANLKADKLLKALKQYFQHELKSENDSQDSEGSIITSSSSDSNKFISNQEDATALVHITKRRKRTATRKETQEKARSTSSGRRQSKRHQIGNNPAKPITMEGTEIMPTENDTSGKIPQYMANLSKPRQVVMKATTTPDFKKLHEAHFKKMESIDKYMERKQKRFDAIGSSIQEVKILVEKSSLLKPPEKRSPGNSLKKPLNPRMSLFSPFPHKGRHSFVCTPSNRRRSPRISNVANRSILTEKSVYKPSVLSTSKMNVRFSETTKDNEHKRSLTKTPARKSPYTCMNTPSGHQKKDWPIAVVKSGSKPVSSEMALEKSKPTALTPFKFAAENIVTPATNNKLTFDLKASLARPLGYLPHKGKLKPWRSVQEKTDATNKSASLKKNYKQHSLQTRKERREMHLQGRKQNKDKMFGAYRGLTMS
uniref:Nucleolar and spindle-associated protein 1 isoform X1 n=1 Tax=Geotrypetes seraphini TaxID=260995 RepID=A0A6P8RTH4_GEOSA|nr:nucleolar and spindle-associated protein 1 isoform X1 [Geotrypetes seraphini]